MSVVVPNAAGSVSYRLVASRATVGRATRPSLTTRTTTLRVVMPTVKMNIPKTFPGEKVKVTGTFNPARARMPVQLVSDVEKKVIATARQDALGRAVFAVWPGKAGSGVTARVRRGTDS